MGKIIYLNNYRKTKESNAETLERLIVDDDELIELYLNDYADEDLIIQAIEELNSK